MTTTSTPAVRFDGWDRPIVRACAKIGEATKAIRDAATHPSFVRGEVTGRTGIVYSL